MVDGRWRAACALLSFLHASARGADHANTTVLNNDYHNSSADEPLRAVYRKVQQVAGMVVS